MSKQATYAEIKDGVVIGVLIETIEQIQEKVDENLLDSVIRMGDGDAVPANGTPAGEVVSSGNGTYAFIKGGLVISIVRAGGDFIQQQTDAGAIDSAVFLGSDDPTPNVGDSFDGVNFIPFVPPLDVAISQKLALFQSAINSFIDSHYDERTFNTLTHMLFKAEIAQLNGTPFANRISYLNQGDAWVSSITAYAVSFAVSVKNQIDAATVIAMQWDIEGNVLPDPMITIGAALLIGD